MKHEITLIGSNGVRTVKRDYPDPLEVGSIIAWPANGQGVRFRVVDVLDGDNVLYCRAVIDAQPVPR